MECPYCFSREVYKSHSGNAAIFSVARLFIVCVRCSTCARRFFHPTMLIGGEEVPQRGDRQAMHSEQEQD